MNKQISILGVRVDCVSPVQTEKQCAEWLSGSKSFHQIVTVNPEFVMEAQHNKEFRDVIHASAFSTADGIGLLLAALYLHGTRLYRLTGVDLTMNLAALCARLGKSIYFLGAEEGIAQKAVNKLKELYPDLMIAGAEEGIEIGYRVKGAGYSKDEFDTVRDQQICKRISDSRADVLLVAFGAPKQDARIPRHVKDLPTVSIAVGVGGTFDYLSGIAPRAPRWMRVIGLEWIFRLMTQPYRWRRIIIATVRFPLAVFFSKFHRQI